MEQIDDNDRLLRPRDVAEILGVSRALVYRADFVSALRGVHLFGALRFRRSAVLAVLEHGIPAATDETEAPR